jgi:hypothetical protein
MSPDQKMQLSVALREFCLLPVHLKKLLDLRIGQWRRPLPCLVTPPSILAQFLDLAKRVRGAKAMIVGLPVSQRSDWTITWSYSNRVREEEVQSEESSVVEPRMHGNHMSGLGDVEDEV